MKRELIHQTLQTINMVRREKAPPVAAYCTLLCLATSYEPMRMRDIRAVMEDESFANGTMDRLVEKGQISASKSADGKTQYVITPLGMQEVKRLVRGTVSRPNPSVQDKKRMLATYNPNSKAS